MKLPGGLTAAEIRVLQEFRRLGTKEMTLDQIKAIKHPTGGAEAPASGLTQKGYLRVEESKKTLMLTEKADELLGYNPLPIAERG